jgi:hypothetical protein
MKKVSLIVAFTLAASSSAFAGGMNQAVTENTVEVVEGTVAGGGRTGLLAVVLAVAVLGALAASSTSSTTSTR